MRHILRLFGWSSFWRDPESGAWYGYAPEQMGHFYSYEEERRPLPTFRQWLRGPHG